MMESELRVSLHLAQDGGDWLWSHFEKFFVRKDHPTVREVDAWASVADGHMMKRGFNDTPGSKITVCSEC